MCLKTMIEKNDLGNICHEHIEFYTLKSLKYLFENNGLEIFKIEENEINGGSYRIFCRKFIKGSIKLNEPNVLNSLKKFGEFLSKKNFSVLIFPEGTRSKNGKVKKFHRSGLKALIKNIPTAKIVPISIKNSWKFSSQNYFPMPLEVKIVIRFHKSLSNNLKNLESLIDTVEATIHKQVMS